MLFNKIYTPSNLLLWNTDLPKRTGERLIRFGAKNGRIACTSYSDPLKNQSNALPHTYAHGAKRVVLVAMLQLSCGRHH